MKTVFITGSNRGIGKAAAEKFLENGWRVVAHSRKPREIDTENVLPVCFDMLDAALMKECVKQLRRDKITIDALVNNAGVAHGGLFQMTPVARIKEVFAVNLFAHMELTQLILKIMAKENASITNVASVAGIDFRAGNCAYGVSKAALIAWTKVLQAELQGKVRVNAVAPGLTETDMAQEMEEKLRASTLRHSVFGRLGKPNEIAQAIYFLASDEASFITGQVLKVDGGGGYIE
ncbi:MAG: SDR family oxidoreductase [Acidaminococcales bacterium]|jgi:3-oxoacyl-[acyl-carrier protein] reductase|nr:SDR family oxidoreductase [Acidaminococcales bacterium]